MCMALPQLLSVSVCEWVWVCVCVCVCVSECVCGSIIGPKAPFFSATVKLIIVLQCIGVSIEGGFEVSVCCHTHTHSHTHTHTHTLTLTHTHSHWGVVAEPCTWCFQKHSILSWQLQLSGKLPLHNTIQAEPTVNITFLSHTMILDTTNNNQSGVMKSFVNCWIELQLLTAPELSHNNTKVQHWVS